jgi:hypothetical protein
MCCQKKNYNILPVFVSFFGKILMLLIEIWIYVKFVCRLHKPLTKPSLHQSYQFFLPLVRRFDILHQLAELDVAVGGQ